MNGRNLLPEWFHQQSDIDRQLQRWDDDGGAPATERVVTFTFAIDPIYEISMTMGAVRMSDGVIEVEVRA